MRAPVAPGDCVHVTLAGSAGEAQVVTRARVVRIERRACRAIAGLEFIQ